MPKARKFKQRGGSLEQPGGLHVSSNVLLVIVAGAIIICGVCVYFALQNRGDINIKLEMPSSSGGPVIVRNPIASTGVPAPPSVFINHPPILTQPVRFSMSQHRGTPKVTSKWVC